MISHYMKINLFSTKASWKSLLFFHFPSRLQSVGTDRVFRLKYFHHGLAAPFHAFSCRVHIDMLGLNHLIKENKKKIKRIAGGGCVCGREKERKRERKKKMLGPVVNPDTSTHTWIWFQTLVFPYHNRCQLLWCRTSRRLSKVSLLCVLKLSVDAILCCATSKRGDTTSPAALWAKYLQISCPRHFPLLVLHSHTGLKTQTGPFWMC